MPPRPNWKRDRALAILRNDPKLSNVEIAERLGVTAHVIGIWLRGEPRQREMTTKDFRARLPFFWKPGGLDF